MQGVHRRDVRVCVTATAMSRRRVTQRARRGHPKPFRERAERSGNVARVTLPAMLFVETQNLTSTQRSRDAIGLHRKSAIDLYFVAPTSSFAMEASFKEKLIQLVKQHECLYNMEHEDYKNVVHKNKVWERIGETLDSDASTAKETWRSVRDGYVRYVKQLNGRTGYGRRLSNYVWSTQLTFLDGHRKLQLKRPSTSTSTLQQDESESTESQSSRRVTSPHQSWSPQPKHVDPVHSPPTRTPEIHAEVCSQTTQIPFMRTDQQSLPYQGPVKRIKCENSIPEDRTDYIEYLQTKSSDNQECDDVEYLFMSYAKTFKKLSLRNQAKLKVDLARLFAEAELRELDNDPLCHD